MNLICVASAVLSFVSLASAEVVSLSSKSFDQVWYLVAARLMVGRLSAVTCP